MSLIQKIETWLSDQVKSWHIRNWTMLLISLICLIYLGFPKVILQTLATIILIVGVAVQIAGYAVWGFTQKNWLKEDTGLPTAVIFAGVCCLIAAILIGYYFVFNQPDNNSAIIMKSLEKSMQAMPLDTAKIIH